MWRGRVRTFISQSNYIPSIHNQDKFLNSTW